MASSVTFKLILNNNNNKANAHIRRLTLRDEEVSLASVRSRARQLFQLRDDAVWFFKWQDEEGDFVTITEDDEFDDVVQTAVNTSEGDWTRSNTIVRLFICVEQVQHHNQQHVLRVVVPAIEEIAAALMQVPNPAREQHHRHQHQGPRECCRGHKKHQQHQEQPKAAQPPTQADASACEFAATCDLSNVRLSMEQGNWYHKPGTTLDLSVEEVSKLSEDEQKMFVRVTQPTDLGVERELYERQGTNEPQQQQQQPHRPHGNWHPHSHSHHHHQRHAAHGRFTHPHHAWAAAAAEAANKAHAHAEAGKQAGCRSRVWPGAHCQPKHCGRAHGSTGFAAHPFAGLHGLFEGAGLAPLQYVGWCDVTGQMLVAGQGWFHKRNSNYDLCESEFNKLGAEDKTLYVRVDKVEDLGANQQQYNALHRAGEMAQHVMQELFGQASGSEEKKNGDTRTETKNNSNNSNDDQPTASSSSATKSVDTCSAAQVEQPVAPVVSDTPAASVEVSSSSASPAPDTGSSVATEQSAQAQAQTGQHQQGAQEDDWEHVAMLRDMGFEDEAECRHVLRESQGDVNAAALALLRARTRWQ